MQKTKQYGRGYANLYLLFVAQLNPYTSDSHARNMVPQLTDNRYIVRWYTIFYGKMLNQITSKRIMQIYIYKSQEHRYTLKIAFFGNYSKRFSNVVTLVSVRILTNTLGTSSSVYTQPESSVLVRTTFTEPIKLDFL